MRLTRWLLSAAVVLAVPGAASDAQSQTAIRCHIPFEFSLQGETFPSGFYSLASLQADPAVWRLHSSDFRVGRLLAVQPDIESPDAGNLVKFHRYGDHYYLSSVVIASRGLSLHFRTSAAEREYAARTAASVVTLVASTR
jgi:hypothetical protein